MATTATKKRSSPARRARPATPSAGKVARKAATNKPARKLTEKLAGKTIKRLARMALKSGAHAIRVATESAASNGRSALERHRLPVQLSIDVAVPISVAWDEWMQSGRLPEGVDQIVDIERDGNTLVGRTDGAHPREWEAEIVDEREHESFAWRSVKGSDCAGLVTFHELSERLTRIELDLDVVPTDPRQALRLSLHLAHRQAEAELRRFKARVEFINPDVYEDGANGNGNRNGNGNGNGNGKEE